LMSASSIVIVPAEVPETTAVSGKKSSKQTTNPVLMLDEGVLGHFNAPAINRVKALKGDLSYIRIVPWLRGRYHPFWPCSF